MFPTETMIRRLMDFLRVAVELASPVHGESLVVDVGGCNPVDDGSVTEAGEPAVVGQQLESTLLLKGENGATARMAPAREIFPTFATANAVVRLPSIFTFRRRAR